MIRKTLIGERGNNMRRRSKRELKAIHTKYGDGGSKHKEYVETKAELDRIANQPKPYRWLRHSSSSNKQLAEAKGAQAVKGSSTRKKYKLRKRGDFYDVYVYSSEKTPF